MSTLRVNKAAIEQAIEALILKKPSLTYEGICDLTSRLPAPYGTVGVKVLNSARKGNNIQATSLQSLAKVLNVEFESLIDKTAIQADAVEGQETDEASQGGNMTAISSTNAPAIIGKENSHISVNINVNSKEK